MLGGDQNYQIQELKEAQTKNIKEHIEEEIGDLLFTVVNLSRFLNINPELALHQSNKKFIRRKKLTSNNGIEFIVNLAETKSLYHNQAFKLESNKLILIKSDILV